MFRHWQKTCIMLTRRCNLKCKGQDIINYPSIELETDVWKKVFDILKSYKVGFTVLFGGEPTLRNDLPELVRDLNSKEMPHTIITNSIRMMSSNPYYKKIIEAEPYGISCNVNEISDSKNNELENQMGVKLLEKLKTDLPNCDLVANITLTRNNLEQVPDLVKYFSEKNVWSILTIIHLCKPTEASYWRHRRPINDENRDLPFRTEDRDRIRKIQKFFYKNYSKFKLHNSREYFKWWDSFGITQNWKCRYWTSPTINPDGSLMICSDRMLSKPFSIFDFPEKEEEIYKSFSRMSGIGDCNGCFWSQMWETNHFADMNKVEEGKKYFIHERRG